MPVFLVQLFPSFPGVVNNWYPALKSGLNFFLQKPWEFFGSSVDGTVVVVDFCLNWLEIPTVRRLFPVFNQASSGSVLHWYLRLSVIFPTLRSGHWYIDRFTFISRQEVRSMENSQSYLHPLLATSFVTRLNGLLNPAPSSNGNTFTLPNSYYIIIGCFWPWI